jgi:uncharacterized protein YndB with AHSA1/START domain
VRYDGVQKMVLVSLPEGMAPSDGAVKLFRSATVKDDQLVNFDGQNTVRIPADALAGGRWHVELNWTSGDTNYFFETAIII